MHFIKLFSFLSLMLFTISSTLSQSDKIDGLTLVAPPEPISADAILKVKEVKADWISLVPYGFSRVGEPKVIFDMDRQWWGEKPEGVRTTIQMAKAQGIKVMVKPQVYIHRTWIGDLTFDTDEAWKKWEADYFNYIDTLLSIAEEEKADLFCIGTECKLSIKERPQFWNKLIAHARQKFSGKLTYSSNWDAFNEVPFWNQLDYIGISAYFPLTQSKTPSVNELTKKWKPIVKRLKKYAKRNNKQILFTEFGYLSIDGCAYRAWELEKEIGKRSINEQAQANALEALFSNFWHESFWAGGFLWKWFPDMQGHEGYPEKDYTPQGKVSEDTIKNWYEKS